MALLAKCRFKLGILEWYHANFFLQKAAVIAG